jgi:hypothetical protein
MNGGVVMKRYQNNGFSPDNVCEGDAFPLSRSYIRFSIIKSQWILNESDICPVAKLSMHNVN